MKYKVLYQQSLLREEFERRKNTNPRYSLRAFAIYLGLDVSTLSRVIAGERILSKKNALNVSRKLQLKENEHNRFILNSENIPNAGIKKTEDVVLLNSNDYGLIIKEWEYFALLDLIKTKNFKNNDSWIAKKLRIKESRVLEVVRNLKKFGLIKDNDGQLIALEKHLTTTEDVPCKVLQEAHIEATSIALKRLTEIDVLFRDFSSITIPANIKKLPLVKEMIRKFRREMMEIMQEGEINEVYQLNIELFPLTEISV